MQDPFGPSNRRGFTLIELLVVIAIIAILAAILFPVFAQAREKARAIDCVSNEKQIALALLQYTQDNDEKFPFGTDGAPGEGWDAHNTFKTPITPNTPAASAFRSSYFWSNTIQPYLKNTAVYQCKDSLLDILSSPFLSPPAISSTGTTYTFNGDLQNYSQAGILQPAVVPLIWAGELNNAIVGYAAASPQLQCPNANLPCVYIPDNSNNTCDTTDNGGTDNPVLFGGLPGNTMFVHGQGDNFAYCDGHVKWMNFNADSQANTGSTTVSGAAAGEPFVESDSSGDVLNSSGTYGYYTDNAGCHTYGFGPDFNP